MSVDRAFWSLKCDLAPIDELGDHRQRRSWREWWRSLRQGRWPFRFTNNLSFARGRPWELRHSVGIRFSVIVGMASALVFVLALFLVLDRIRVQDAAQAALTARDTTQRLSAAVQRVFEDAFAVVGFTHDELLTMKEDGVQDPVVYDALVRRMIDGDRFGAWLVWDGRDAPGGLTIVPRLDPQGRFAFYTHQNGMEMLREAIPAEVLASDLYKVPRNESRDYLLAPHQIDAINGDPTFVTSFSRPIQQDGRTVGVLAVDVKLDALTQAIASLEMPRGAALAIVAEDGMVAAASDKSWIGRPLSSRNSIFSTLLARAKGGDGSMVLPGATSPVLASWKAIRFAEVKNPWFVLITTPEVSLLAGDWHDHVRVLVIMSAAIFAVLLIVLVTMHRIILVPLRRVSRIIDDLGEGMFGMDVPHRHRKDEIGDVARAIERLQDSAQVIARLHEENGEREYQRVMSRETELATIAARFSASIETVVGSLRRVSTTIGGRSRTLNETVDAATGGLNDLSLASISTRTNMLEAAHATSSLLSSIETIGVQTRLCSDAASSVDRHAGETNVSLSCLKKSVADISALVELIGSVAVQINLIALNATIEAARAGDAGRGFAVVAKEVKTLAARTSAAADAVAAHIHALEQSSANTHASVAKMENAFNGMQSISSTIAKELNAQLAATGSINSLLDQALRSADMTAGTAVSLTAATSEVAQGINELHHQNGRLEKEVIALDTKVNDFVRFLATA